MSSAADRAADRRQSWASGKSVSFESAAEDDLDFWRRATHRERLEAVFRLVRDAVLATYGDVTKADEDFVLGQAGWPRVCFLCNRQLEMVRGDRATQLPKELRALAVEFEHIWPRSFGGNTIAANLALACHGCNQRKSNFANWAMVDVQSLVLGWNPSDDALKSIAGSRRFALISRSVFRLAHEESLTLKQAHLRIQTRIAAKPKVRRIVDAADFFNLTCLSGDD